MSVSRSSNQYSNIPDDHTTRYHTLQLLAMIVFFNFELLRRPKISRSSPSL